MLDLSDLLKRAVGEIPEFDAAQLGRVAARRKRVRAAMVMVVTVALAGAVALAVGVRASRSQHGRPPIAARVVTVEVADLRPGEVLETRYKVRVGNLNAPVFVVDVPHEGVLALVGRSTSGGCRVEWVRAPGYRRFESDPRVAFEDPCHGALYALNGDCLGGGCYRGLDRVAATRTGTELRIDLNATHRGRTIQTANRPSPPPTAVSTALPVVACRTDLALTPASPPSSIVPPTNLSGDAASRLSIYADTTGKLVVLAPRHWTCSATFGADGSGGLTASPTAKHAPFVTASTDGGCAGCTTATVCTYFPDLAQPGTDCAPVPPATTIFHPARHLARYIRAGEEGVIIAQQLAGQTIDWSERCRLPPANSSVCDTILTAFIHEHPPS